MKVKKQQLELDMEKQTGSKSGKELRQGCILSHSLFNLYAEYIMRNAGLDEAQAGIKIVERHTLTLWLIHVSVWQKPPQYCKVISVQLKLMNELKKDCWEKYQ